MGGIAGLGWAGLGVCLRAELSAGLSAGVDAGLCWVLGWVLSCVGWVLSWVLGWAGCCAVLGADLRCSPGTPPNAPCFA